jgi:hypothetical protein
VFKRRFLDVSREILVEASPDNCFLADLLMEKIEEEGYARRKNVKAGV